MLQKTYFWSIISPGKTTTCPQRNFSRHKKSCKYCRWYFHQFLEKILLRLDSNGITLNFKKCLISRESLFFDSFFYKNKTDHKNAHTKNCKNFRKLFLGFPNFTKQFIPNYSTLKCTHTSLERTLTKGRRFWLEWNQ